jgi:LmbE family N-acetylglucosaminyl deacetylase
VIELEGKVVVLSPHLDDAVLSIGAGIRRATRLSRAGVTTVTVMGCDPHSHAPAGFWDRQSGFRTEGEAARRRREEDRRACQLVGASPVWLTFGDMTYGLGAEEDEVLAAILPHLEGADLLLVPGFPLDHDDHLWLTDLTLRHLATRFKVALYVEQPYVVWRSPRKFWRSALNLAPATTDAIRTQVGDALDWRPLPADDEDRMAKREACLAYRSQLRTLGGKAMLRRIARYEARYCGEPVAPIGDSRA